MGSKELDEDLRSYKVDVYHGWQEKLPSVRDQGQRGQPGNLRGLLQHIRNVWEHRYSFSDMLGCAPQVMPATMDVMEFLTAHFPDIDWQFWLRIVIHSTSESNFPLQLEFQRARLAA